MTTESSCKVIARATIDILEPRQLLNATFASLTSHGTLNVVGDGTSNVITIEKTGSNVVATRDGAVISFAAFAVKRVWVDAFGGNDRITNSVNVPATIFGNSGNDTVIGGPKDDSLEGGSGGDHLDGRGGNNMVNPGGGKDVLDYSGNPLRNFLIDAEGDVSPSFFVRRATVFLNSDEADHVAFQPELSIITTPGDDRMRILVASDFRIFLGSGKDIFNTAFGSADLVDGGPGNDYIADNVDGQITSVIGGSGDDHIVDEAGSTHAAFIDGGSGYDFLELSPDAPGAPYVVAVPTGVEKMTVTGGGSFQVTANDLGDDITVDASGPSTLTGGTGNDRLTLGTSRDDDMVSLISGGKGNDILKWKGQGATVFKGGAGIDTADFSERTSAVKVSLDNVANDGGFEDVSPADFNADPHSDVRSDIEVVLGGSRNDKLVGGPFDNTLIGNGGNDQLFGGAGNDVLDGGRGRDHLFGQDGNDTLLAKDGRTDTLDGGAGFDKARRDNTASIKDQELNVESFI